MPTTAVGRVGWRDARFSAAERSTVKEMVQW